MIKLKILLEQVLKEIGDFENINPYKFYQIETNSYKFITEQNHVVEVNFKKYDEDDIKYMGWDGETWNLVYSIDGVQSQLEKSKYGYLIKIVKTVFDISVDWINKNKNLNQITIFAGNKNKDIFLTVTDEQKLNLYTIIFIKNYKKLNGKWWYKDIKLDDNFKGIAIYKEK